MMRALVLLMSLLAVSLLTASCAGIGHRVDRELLRAVPNDELLLLFDAENGVYIAKDERADAEQRLLAAEKAYRSAVSYREVIEERRNSGEAIDTPAVLQLLDEWNSARVELRAAEVRFARQKRETSTMRLWASRARYEKAKADLVKEHNPEAGNSLELEPFVEQVSDWEAREQESIVLLAEREADVSQQRQTYNALSDQLQKQSGGAYGGPWADLLD